MNTTRLIIDGNNVIFVADLQLSNMVNYLTGFTIRQKKSVAMMIRVSANGEISAPSADDRTKAE